MNVAAIVQARMGSTRLPGKIMLEVEGKPLLGWMLQRLTHCQKISQVVIATTDNSADDVVADYVARNGVAVFRGSELDVLDRYYQAAKSVGADWVVRLTSDCPLIDPAVVDSLVALAIERKLDFVSNSEPLPATVPDGMDVSVVSFKALETAWEQATKPSEREHVTFHFWNNPERYSCLKVDGDEDLSALRLTVDYPEDFALIQCVIKHFTDSSSGRFTATMEEIVDFLKRNPEVVRLNSSHVRGEGWLASFERDKQLGVG